MARRKKIALTTVVILSILGVCTPFGVMAETLHSAEKVGFAGLSRAHFELASTSDDVEIPIKIYVPNQTDNSIDIYNLSIKETGILDDWFNKEGIIDLSSNPGDILIIGSGETVCLTVFANVDGDLDTPFIISELATNNFCNEIDLLLQSVDDQFTTSDTITPEPGTLMLLCLGGLPLIFRKRK